jgi:RHS repeat-associated protein
MAAANRPWGVVLKGIGTTNTIQNRFEYQGKESEKTFGLNRINLGARTYNPTIGRFDRIDASAEKYASQTPMNSFFNNPVLFIDPDGNDGDYYDTDANYLGNDGIDDGKIYVLNDGLRAKTENTEVNWGETLDKRHSDALKKNSQEAETPGKITYKLDEDNPSAEKYNQYDKEIAVATHLINREINKGTLSIGSNYTLGEKATKLDVNLVKALAYKESRIGQGMSLSTKASDIFSMFNTGDYGDKGKMGMTLNEVKLGGGAAQSTNWGLRWLYYKSFRSEGGMVKNFQGWDYAIQKYGPGAKEPNYKKTVYDIYNSIQK